MRQRLRGRRSTSTTLTWALATCGIAAAVLFPGITSAAPSIEIPGAMRVLTAQPSPPLTNDGGRCAALAFVEFEDVPDATGYRAELLRVGGDGPEDYRSIADDYQVFWAPGNITQLDTPDGSHWIGPVSSYSVGTNCDDARAVVEGAWTVVRVQALFDGNNPPFAFFTADADGLSVDFDASGSRDLDGEVVSWTWDFDDDETGTGRETSHRYDAPGTYRVKLTVEDDDGAKDDFWLRIDLAGGLVVNSAGNARDEVATDEDASCDTGGTVTRGGQQEAECTLRAAIEQANASAGPDTIGFDIPGGGAAVISAGAGLPAIDGLLIVDGTSQPVAVEGPGSGTGLTVSGDDVEIRGLSLAGWTEGIALTGSRIELSGAVVSDQLSISDASEVTIGGTALGSGGCVGECNRLAGPVVVTESTTVRIVGNEASEISATGSSVQVTGNRIDDSADSAAAVHLVASRGTVGGSGADGNRIVATHIGVQVEEHALADGSLVISGNEITTPGAGIDVAEDAAGVIVGGATEGNRIAADASGVELRGDGNVVRGNTITGAGGFAGVAVSGDGNQVGGLAAGEGNEVSGYDSGVEIQASSGTTVAGNVIGVSRAGVAQPNDIGVNVIASSGVPDTVIEGNVISGNREVGITVRAEGVTVRGNKVGTDPTGLVAVANRVGIAAGEPAVIEDNLVSGNLDTGLVVDAASTLLGNGIGTDASGDGPLGNGTGIVLGGPATQQGTSRIGGLADGDGNTIAFNRSTGVLVNAGSSRIRGNSIHSNGGLGIDLAPAGVTANDPGDGDAGPNGLQNFPELSAAVLRPEGLVISGSLPGASSLALYSVDVYTSADCDPLTHGEGARLVGSTSAIGANDAFGDIVVPSPPADAVFVTAIATGPDGSSEFSECTQLVEDSGRDLGASAPAGSTQLQVDPTGLVGKVVTIGSGATLEQNYGTAAVGSRVHAGATGAAASGALVLARPTRFAHAAGEPVVALDDTLFVSVDKAVVTRSSRLPDLAVLTGRVRAVEGRSIACGDDVTLTLDGSTVAQKAPGTKFVRQKGNRCVFVAKTSNGIGRFELDLGKGTWNAEVVRKDLEKLTSPVDVGLQIGDDDGSESLGFKTNGAIWTYVR
jgi:hypothetical protein